MTQVDARNHPDEAGSHSEQLRAAGAAWTERLAKNPKAGQLTFTVRGRNEGAIGSRIKAGRHTLLIDEPPMLAGKDSGPSPVETLLSALIGCQIATYRLYAAAMNIKLDAIDIKGEGDFDVRGALTDDDSIRPGFSAIRLTLNITGPESEERYEKLRQMVDAHCPVHDMVSNGVPITAKVHKAEASA